MSAFLFIYLFFGEEVWCTRRYFPNIFAHLEFVLQQIVLGFRSGTLIGPF